MGVRVFRLWWVIGVLVGLGWAPLASAQDFPLDQWLDEPDVKLVAVEFYADWCEPCKEAAPKWEKLRKKYADQGLKLVVINTRSKRPGCPKLPWKPDESLCDPKGELADSLGVGQLPSAFLWSWQGNLLVDRGGHVEDVEEVVREYLDTNPRVQVVAKNARGKEDTKLKRLFEAELSREGKLTVVADQEMRKRLARVRKESWDPSKKDRQRCNLGQEVAANSIFSVEVQGEEVAVMLINAETGCQRGVFSGWDRRKRSKSAARAVHKILAELKHRPSRMPGVSEAGSGALGLGKGRPTVSESRDSRGDADWEVAAKETSYVTFESEPPGAEVWVNGISLGKPQTDAKDLTRKIPRGEHRVRMALTMYKPAVKMISVKGGQERVSFELEEDFAELDLDSTPPGLWAYMDGKRLGRTPIEGHRVSAGPHELGVTDRCYFEWRKAVIAEPGTPLSFEPELEPKMAAVEVSAHFHEDDVPAVISVDGDELGPTPGPYKVPLCSKEIEVRPNDDALNTWTHSLDLKHRETWRDTAEVSDEASRAKAELDRQRFESIGFLQLESSFRMIGSAPGYRITAAWQPGFLSRYVFVGAGVGWAVGDASASTTVVQTDSTEASEDSPPGQKGVELAHRRLFALNLMAGLQSWHSWGGFFVRGVKGWRWDGDKIRDPEFRSHGYANPTVSSPLGLEIGSRVLITPNLGFHVSYARFDEGGDYISVGIGGNMNGPPPQMLPPPLRKFTSDHRTVAGTAAVMGQAFAAIFLLVMPGVFGL